jgi:hypothetical protein
MGETEPVSVAELVDTQQRTIAPFDVKGTLRSDATVVTIGQQTLVAGGRDARGKPVKVAEVLDFTGHRASLDLPEAKWAMAGAESLGKGFLFGGLDGNGQVTSDVVLFDPLVGQFQVAHSEVTARAWASAVALSDGRVLVVGGMDADGQAVADVDLFDPKLGMLCPIGKLQYPRWHAAAVRLPDGSAFVIGGLTGADPGWPTADAEILDPRFVSFESSCHQVNGDLSTKIAKAWIPRYAASAVVMPNHMVAVTGGLTVGPDERGDLVTYPVNQIEVFVPEL